MYVCNAIGGKGCGMCTLGLYNVMFAQVVDVALLSVWHIALLNRMIVLVRNLE